MHIDIILISTIILYDKSSSKRVRHGGDVKARIIVVKDCTLAYIRWTNDYSPDVAWVARA